MHQPQTYITYYSAVLGPKILAPIEPSYTNSVLRVGGRRRCKGNALHTREFPGAPYFGVHIIRILLFRVLY